MSDAAVVRPTTPSAEFIGIERRGDRIVAMFQFVGALSLISERPFPLDENNVRARLANVLANGGTGEEELDALDAIAEVRARLS